MRVLCINDNWDPAPGMENAPRPVCGNDYTANNTVSAGGDCYYTLLEMGSIAAYLCSHFAILPDEPAEVIEELELIEE